VKGAEGDAYFVGKGKAAPKTRAKKDEKVYLEIDARFEKPTRGGRGRGDRGGGERGGRGMRGPRRGLRSNDGTSPVNVDDEVAFPSLS
jgi:plasminogen activator inhibitor 1 RNA-binding protein